MTVKGLTDRGAQGRAPRAPMDGFTARLKNPLQVAPPILYPLFSTLCSLPFAIISEFIAPW